MKQCNKFTKGRPKTLLAHVKSVLRKHIKRPELSSNYETVIISLDERHKLSGNKKPYTVLTGEGSSARNRLLNITLQLKFEHEISSEKNWARHYETSPKKSSGEVCSLLRRREIPKYLTAR
jgi:hypothetical protein